MEQDLKTPLLDNIFSALKRSQKIVKRSQRWDQILFWIIAANALYLSWSFIYHTSITSYMNRSEFIEIYKLPLIAEAFSVLVGLLLIPIKKRNQKKLRSLPVTAIREIFERGEVPSLIIPLSEQEDPYLDLIEQVFPNIKDFQTEILDGRTLDTLLRISSLIDWDQDLGTLREILVSEIESLSEQERAEFVKKCSELEKFFSELGEQRPDSQLDFRFLIYFKKSGKGEAGLAFFHLDHKKTDSCGENQIFLSSHISEKQGIFDKL